MKLCFCKVTDGLVPLDEDAHDVFGKWPVGAEIMIEAKRPRSVRQHRLFFGLLRALVDNSDLFETVEAAKTAVLIAIGEVDIFIDPVTFDSAYTPRSIAFESCKQDKFNEIFEAALRVICQRYLSGLETDELREHVFNMVDDKRASTLGRRVLH